MHDNQIDPDNLCCRRSLGWRVICPLVAIAAEVEAIKITSQALRAASSSCSFCRRAFPGQEGKIGLITIDESFVEAGKSQRGYGAGDRTIRIAVVGCTAAPDR
jgi:hypothetical protein